MQIIDKFYVDSIGNAYNRKKKLLNDTLIRWSYGIFSQEEQTTVPPLVTNIPFWPYFIHLILQRFRKLVSFKFFKWEFHVAPLNYAISSYFIHLAFYPFNKGYERWPKVFKIFRKWYIILRARAYERDIFKKNPCISLNPDKKYILCLNTFISSFGHFTWDVLPAVNHAINHIPNALDSTQYTFLIPALNQSALYAGNPYDRYIMPALQALGIHLKQCIFLKENEIVTGKTLYLVDTRDINIDQHKTDYDVYEKIFHYYRDDALQEKYKDYEKIYVSRAKRNTRKVEEHNEQELIQALHKLGFKSVDMEDFTFKESVNLMHNVKIYVSMEGSAQMNTLYSSHKVTLLIFQFVERSLDIGLGIYFKQLFDYKWIWFPTQYCEFQEDPDQTFGFSEIIKIRIPEVIRILKGICMSS